jgi:hypothetical protein
VPIPPMRGSERLRRWPSRPKRPSPSCMGIRASDPLKSQGIRPTNRQWCDSSTSQPQADFSRL